jgi:hypothetical protein
LDVFLEQEKMNEHANIQSAFFNALKALKIPIFSFPHDAFWDESSRETDWLLVPTDRISVGGWQHRSVVA